MRIAMINATGGGMSGGYRTYLRNVLPRLAVHPDVEAVLCATPPMVGVEAWFFPMPKVQFVPCRPFQFMQYSPDADLAQSVKVFAPDVVFIPVERYLTFKDVPIVVMLQNMAPLAPVAGNPWGERLRYVAQRHETRIAVQRADQVIVPTNFVRDFLIEKWLIPGDKVTTIHYGASVYAPLPSGEGSRVRAIPEEWAGQFLFTAGSIEPYRGLEDVLQAMHYLRDNAKVVGLVVAGEARWNMVGYQRRLQRLIKHHRLQNKVRWTGVLKEEELSWCYRNCAIFVMTSRVESFGITGLEALAQGCVSVVADNHPLPEIFGKAASYYAPGDGKSLAHAIERVLLLDGAQRQAASARAKERTALFSWDNTVGSTVRLFTEVIR